MKPAPTAEERKQKNRRKAFWTKQFYAWHWISSALSLAGILLFAVTGITLNHAGQIPATPQIQEHSLVLPETWMGTLAYSETEPAEAPLPRDLARWLHRELDAPIQSQTAEWSEDEIYLGLPRPGGDAWLAIDRASGEVTYERTDRGAISFLNDLHKGRHTGPLWSLFIDVFSVATVLFSLTGLALLWVHSRRRPSTWPLVAAGVLMPIVLIIFFIH
ncbi:hypothetical protein HNR46_002974 [Haloferula luteola]|uniref:PepSY-associated TM helix n=1 Tax=Haloferula luteola TaxID=595692 RepID=A0A840V6R3_9BACT|nr:PepSY-associated TM helix domain-containing protein [Haloferula luteola]MBB5352726.1 hypothetical protein [Haloferula luteola]